MQCLVLTKCSMKFAEWTKELKLIREHEFKLIKDKQLNVPVHEPSEIQKRAQLLADIKNEGIEKF